MAEKRRFGFREFFQVNIDSIFFLRLAAIETIVKSFYYPHCFAGLWDPDNGETELLIPGLIFNCKLCIQDIDLGSKRRKGRKKCKG